jgi:hypothetical protein
MKLVFTLFVISSLIFASCSIDQANTEQKKEKTPAVNEDKNAGIYGYESGMVETHFGDTKNKEILYFDKWGTLSAKYVYTENRHTGELIMSSIEIVKNGITYFIDPVAKTGLKMGNSFGQNDIGDAKDLLGFQEDRKVKMLGSHLSGTDLLNGKKCSVYRDDAKEMSQTTYIHMGLVLKTIITLDGDEIVSEATDIQFNVTIPADIFEIPKGIRFN